MPTPTITALIPTHRRPLLLKRALESVLGQTWPHLEVLVSDNASQDGTRELVESIAAQDSRVRYHEQPEDIGAVKNFQFLLDQVKTPWVSILSDDDALLPGFYAHAIEQLEEHREARFFCGQTVVYDEDVGTYRVDPHQGWDNGFILANTATALMTRRLFPWTGCLFSREVFDVAGPLLAGSYADLVFMVRAAAHFPFVVSLNPCAIFRSWSKGSLRMMEAEEITSAYRVSREALLDDPAINVSSKEAIRARLEALPELALGKRVAQAFDDAQWERFDRIAEILGTPPNLKFHQRLQLYTGRRRDRHPHLLKLARWLLERRLAVAKKKELATFDELVARYSVALMEGSD